MSTEGPLGFAMSDDQAKACEVELKRAVGPYQHTMIKSATIERMARTDISWISTEIADRYNHIIVATGMNDAVYALNPIVTLQHDYSIPPIGKSLWRKIARKAGTKGIQAQTYYPERPIDYQGEWRSDTVWAQIVSGLLNGKSIGFLPTKIIEPSNPDHPLIIQEWTLIEYACGGIPVNPETLVLQINKSIKEDETKAIVSAIEKIDVEVIIQNALSKLRGQI